MHNTFRMLFVTLMTDTLVPDVNEHVRVVHSCVKRDRAVSFDIAGTVADEIMDYSKARRTSRSRYRRRRNQGSQ
jgi:hypothetical protein